ncbi:MAG TPA: hypothetical protein VEK08_03060 [Planctomycetota bacterium]|nr:hypothetical protein [Planctomycetota bacterium]
MRAAETILLITSELIARADFSGGTRPRLLGMRQQRRPSDSDLGKLLTEAAKLEKGIGRRVWVLCEDLWTQLLTVPSAAVNGLEEEQVLRALAFEAEGLSGTPAADAVLGARQIQADQTQSTFWISSIERPVLDQFQRRVREMGGKLAGLCHPAGLPAPILQQPGTWRRVESWSQSTVCITIEAGKPRVAVFGPSSDQQDEGWLRTSTADHTELLFSSGRGPDAGLMLSDPKVLESWLTAWAAQLVSPALAAPCIVPDEIPVATSVLVTWGVLIEAAVLALCVAHWSWTTRATDEALRQAAALRAPAEQMATVDKAIGSKRSEYEKLKTEVINIETERKNALREFAVQKGRVLQLLSSLAECKVADVMIEKIEPDGASGTTVQGLCMNPAQADELAIQLMKPLDSVGLEVVPLSKQGKNLLTDGGPWNFTLSIRPKAQRASSLTAKDEGLSANARGGQP